MADPEAHPDSSRQNVTPPSLWPTTLHMPPSSTATLYGEAYFIVVHVFNFSVRSLLSGLCTPGISTGLHICTVLIYGC